eukprot:CAMPEP_0194357832 /NCGR_PEP_ID=MMETSP0174-20130528/5259_1 /TAXON_ID=216777 /ORGANISM="Proboscia alata, Strain PI-D3" /LENGTH=1345 /DNA_ID=CAMNT_0039128017 /DNA_START=35 /DNA_END=4069 /DNA_ORIENTATION=+
MAPMPTPHTSEITTSSAVHEGSNSINKAPISKSKKRKNVNGCGRDRRLVEYFLVVSSVQRLLPLDENIDGDSTLTEEKIAKKDNDEFAEKGKESPSSVDKSIDAKAENNEGDDAFDDDKEDDYSSYQFEPTITSRYPLADHDDNPLHESVSCFCYPNGSISLSKEHIMPKIHFFVATGGRGQQMYGACLTFHEPYVIHNRSKAPKVVSPSSTPSKSKVSDKKARFFLPKCFCILSAHPFLTAFREYLTQLYRLAKSGTMTVPIERFITNFCSEVPLPPPGSMVVQTTILDSVIRLWSPPHNIPTAWVSLPFAHLFQCLDLENVVKVWHALALEQQVLLTSTQMSLLTTCSEILISLLFPMKWSHAYIPVLPHLLIPILSAPMPFLCGICKTNLNMALTDLNPECIVVDLDKNMVTNAPSTDALASLPKALSARLEEKLDSKVGMVYREARCLRRKDDISEMGMHLPIHTKAIADATWESQLCLFDEAFHLYYTPEESRKNLLNGSEDSQVMENGSDIPVSINLLSKTEREKLKNKQSSWDAVQESFLDIYTSMLQNYRKFLVFPSKKGPKNDSNGNEDNVNDASFSSYGGAGFRTKQFIESQRYDMQPFLRQLCSTQQFDNFITKRLYGSGEPDVIFFDMAIDRLIKINEEKKSISNIAGGFGALMNLSWGRSQSKDHNAGSKNTINENKKPLLQSAVFRRKLKTIVPPEPSLSDLPKRPTQSVIDNMLAFELENSEREAMSSQDDISVSSRGSNHSSYSGVSAISGLTSRTGGSKDSKGKPGREKKSKKHRHKESVRYVYPTFPEKLDSFLFGTPRPTSGAVLAEFDRQKEESAKFNKHGGNLIGDSSNKVALNSTTVGNKDGQKDAAPCAEVATFTLFFMAFTAVVGKELLELSYDSDLKCERSILSTYVPPEQVKLRANSETIDILNELEGPSRWNEQSSIENTEATESVVTPDENSDDASDVDFDDVKSNLTEATETTSAPSTPTRVINGSNDDVEERPILTSRNRFNNSLTVLEIEEAKATAKAQLVLAFDILEMMRERILKADPEAYQCLIDACGRCGDTERATKLLSRMHEDGIVADGVVYACLVSAFSAESAWKKLMGKKEEDLPEWANGASVEMDWNKLQNNESFTDIAKKHMTQAKTIMQGKDTPQMNIFPNSKSVGGLLQKLRGEKKNEKKNDNVQRGASAIKARTSKREEVRPRKRDMVVTEPVLIQILLGENLLELIYPDIAIEMDNETCPRCNSRLSDEEVVSGWTGGDAQSYTTTCALCAQKFVPHFSVQSTSPSFMGSRGPSSPLFCERLSPWVLQKELRTVMSDKEGIENILSTEWRKLEARNATLWW